jgi:hypothetical protein
MIACASGTVLHKKMLGSYSAEIILYCSTERSPNVRADSDQLGCNRRGGPTDVLSKYQCR